MEKTIGLNEPFHARPDRLAQNLCFSGGNELVLDENAIVWSTDQSLCLYFRIELRLRLTISRTPSASLERCMSNGSELLTRIGVEELTTL